MIFVQWDPGRVPLPFPSISWGISEKLPKCRVGSPRGSRLETGNPGSAATNYFDVFLFAGGYWYNDCYISNLNGQYCRSDENHAKCMAWWGKEGRRNSQGI